jgi:hypothetical protein
LGSRRTAVGAIRELSIGRAFADVGLQAKDRVTSLQADLVQVALDLGHKASWKANGELVCAESGGRACGW